ncbi:MAG: T9SS type A sorting domain-containing protein [Bacteroidia bacterium]
MKQFFLSLLFVIVGQSCFAQTQYKDSIFHDGFYRYFIVYVPSLYDGSKEVPLVMNFHGRSRSAENQLGYGDFRPLADTANFIVVHPQGLKDNQGRTTWNLGNSSDTMDDVGFVDSLIDYLHMNYEIDLDRVYGTGFSRGFFFVCQASCSIGSRFAAVGGVGAAFVDSTGCYKHYPKPFMQIHGTADPTVGYEDYEIAFQVSLIAEYNLCASNPSIVHLPNVNKSDNSYVTKISYNGCYREMDVVHLRVNDGGHTWPGVGNALPNVNYDIKASDALWEFFSKYDRTGRIGYTSVENLSDTQFKLYPNPAHDLIRIEYHNSGALNYTISNVLGEILHQGQCYSGDEIKLNDFQAGTYFFAIGGDVRKVLVY